MDWKAADVFSAACILVEIFSMDFVWKKGRSDNESKKDAGPPELGSLPLWIRHCLAGCFDEDPEKRPKVHALLHRFPTSIVPKFFVLKRIPLNTWQQVHLQAPELTDGQFGLLVRSAISELVVANHDVLSEDEVLAFASEKETEVLSIIEKGSSLHDKLDRLYDLKVVPILVDQLSSDVREYVNEFHYNLSAGLKSISIYSNGKIQLDSDAPMKDKVLFKVLCGFGFVPLTRRRRVAQKLSLCLKDSDCQTGSNVLLQVFMDRMNNHSLWDIVILKTGLRIVSDPKRRFTDELDEPERKRLKRALRFSRGKVVLSPGQKMALRDSSVLIEYVYDHFHEFTEEDTLSREPLDVLFADVVNQSRPSQVKGDEVEA